MKHLSPSLVAIHQDVLNKPAARARVERLMQGIACSDVREVDDAALAALAEERWGGFTRCGELGQQRCPDIVFNSWMFGAPEEEVRERLQRHPALATRGLVGRGGLGWRRNT